MLHEHAVTCFHVGHTILNMILLLRLSVQITNATLASRYTKVKFMHCIVSQYKSHRDCHQFGFAPNLMPLVSARASHQALSGESEEMLLRYIKKPVFA